MILGIELRNIRKSFGRAVTLDGITLDVARGEVVGLLGQNGSGKTTTLRIIAGLLAADEGDVLVGGQQLAPDNPDGRARIGYLPERTPLYEALTVREYLEFAITAKGVAKACSRHEQDRVIAAFALAEALDKPISRLSKGFRQRVGLAQACLGEPEVLLLDEATNGLDPLQIIEARKMIQAAAQDCAVLFCSHLMQEVAAMCSRALILHGGRVRGEVALRGTDGKPLLAVSLLGIDTVKASALLGDVHGIEHVDAWPVGVSAEVELSCRLEAACDDGIVNRVAAALMPHCHVKSLGFAQNDLERRFLVAIGAAISPSGNLPC